MPQGEAKMCIFPEPIIPIPHAKLVILRPKGSMPGTSLAVSNDESEHTYS